MIHKVKGFGIVNKAEIDVFLELSCFFDDPADVGNLISGSSAFSKTSLNIRKFTVHTLLKPGLDGLKGVKPPEAFGERSRDWSLGYTGDEGPQVAMTGEARGCSRAAAPVCGFPRGTTARSVSLSHN